MRHLAAVKWQFLAAILFGLIYAAASGFGMPVMIGTVFPVVFGDEAAPMWLQNIVVSVVGEDKLEQSLLMGTCLLIPIVFTVRGLSGFLNAYWVSFCGMKILEILRVEMFRRVQSLPMKFFGKNKSGDILSRIMGDTAMLQSVITRSSNDLIKEPLTLISALSTLIYLSIAAKQNAILLLCIITVPAVIIPVRLIGKRMLKKARQLQTETGELTSSLTESLQSPMEIRAYNMQDRQVNRFEKDINSIFKVNMKIVKYGKILSPMIEALSAFGIAIALYFAVGSGITFAAFSQIVGCLYICYEPVKKLSALVNTLHQGEASLDRLEYIINQPDSLPDPDHPIELGKVEGRVTFKDVHFSYDDEPVLRGINVDIQPGEVVALVGPSGAGKSTFANLVERFYDIDSGAIELDGKDLRCVTKAELRENIALVPQSPVLFHGTVGENIELGKPGALQSEIEQAAQRAQAHDFISREPAGYQSEVGEKGSLFSGGQKQRIAIARAFLKDSPLLILDEATSALDSESEAQIQNALDQLVKGRTTFIIAHRFSSIKIASRILVFDQGEIIADGPHEEIYQSCGLYRELYKRQSGEREGA